VENIDIVASLRDPHMMLIDMIERPDRDASLFSQNPDGRMLRFRPYKYVHSQVYGEEHEILFDLEADPDETTNVFSQPGYEDVSAYARATLDAWLGQQGLSLTFEET
jgi:hypothetical protein